MSETMTTSGVGASGVSGIAKRRIQFDLSLTLGRRFALLLALFPLGGVIIHGHQTTPWLVGSLVLLWGVANLAESLLTAWKHSEQSESKEALVINLGLL